ncbi:hypothetical protein ACYULU_01450 [Breznakiellaceae bacterium SP9]
MTLLAHYRYGEDGIIRYHSPFNLYRRMKRKRKRKRKRRGRETAEFRRGSAEFRRGRGRRRGRESRCVYLRRDIGTGRTFKELGLLSVVSVETDTFLLIRSAS